MWVKRGQEKERARDFDLEVGWLVLRIYYSRV